MSRFCARMVRLLTNRKEVRSLHSTQLQHPFQLLAKKEYQAVVAACIVLLLAVPSAADAQSAECPSGQLAFPGAEGFGRCTEGGRGGRTIDVTNLNDSGPGSLRQCAQVESGPRICRILVSGTIDSNIPGGNAEIMIRNSYVTIDGSTAPAGGIALKDHGINVMANHVILRHLRIRPGLAQYSEVSPHSLSNGITIRSNEGVIIHHVIVDHCSVSWGTDDMTSVIFGSDYVTIQWSIIAEGLTDCGPECGGKLFLNAYGAQHVSFHHNLGTNTYSRFPEATGGGSSVTGYLDFVNNVHYNGNGTDTLVDPYGGSIGGPIHVNFVGNSWKLGPNAARFPLNQSYASIRTIGGLPSSTASTIWADDNYGRYWNGQGGVAWGLASPDTAIIWGDNGGIPLSPNRHNFPLVTTYGAVANIELVLNGAGAFPRDSVDARVVNDYRNGTGTFVSNPLNVGGWPDLTKGGGGDVTPPGAPSNLRVN